MTPLRIIFCGQRSFGAAALEALLKAGHQVLAAYVPEPGADQRGLDRALMAADRLRVPIRHGLRAATMPADADLVVCAHSHDFVSAPTLRKTRLGGIGYHPSLLPRHRGRDAVEWTVRMGDRVTGGSVYWLSDTVDAGPLAAQRHVMVRPADTASELWRRELFPLGVRLLASACRDIAAGRLVTVPQDEACATWEPSIGRAPLFRPDLPMLAAPGSAGMAHIVSWDAASDQAA